MMPRFTPPQTALEAQAAALKLAFGPVVFQCVRIAWKTGLLSSLEHSEALEVGALAARHELSEYAISVLLESCLSAQVVAFEDEKYSLTKVGYFVLHDPMSKINFDFMHDVCYPGLHLLEESLQHGATAVMTMDADGQHRAEDIPRLLEASQAHPDRLIIGSRLHDRSQFPTRRYLANRFANFWVAWAAGYPLSDSQSGFRVYPGDLLRAYLAACRTTHGFVFESEIIIEAGRRGCAPLAVAVPAIYVASARKSHFRPVLDIARITRMVALKLLQRKLCPLCLWRSLRTPQTYPASHNCGLGNTRSAGLL